MPPGPTSSSEIEDDLRREDLLLEWFRHLSGSPVLAFSGGVDSSYLLAVAAEGRGPRGVRAVLGVSPSLAGHQRQAAREMAGLLGVGLEEVTTREGEREGYRSNLGDRCFFCKDTLFATLADLHPGALLLDGTNADDLQDHRPGLRAGVAHEVRSPLAEMGLSKAAIRRLSRRRGLPTADRPSSPCLASRFPAGVAVTDEGLRRVEAAEEHLRSLGFPVVRVRHHGELARVEVPLEDLPRLLDFAVGPRVVEQLRLVGYRFVALDLEGYRSGSGARLSSAEAVE